MIRKPTGWHAQDDSAAADAAPVTGLARVVYRSGHFAIWWVLYAIALFWGYVAYTAGLENLPICIGFSAMAAVMYVLGRRAWGRALAA